LYVLRLTFHAGREPRDEENQIKAMQEKARNPDNQSNFNSDLHQMITSSVADERELKESESEDESFESDKEDDDDTDNEWGGEPSRIEATVLSHVKNINDAAWLIVELHKEYTKQEQQRIGGWQKGILYGIGTGGASSSRVVSQDSNSGESSSDKRKKRRLSKNQGREFDDEELDGNGDDGNNTPPGDNSDPALTSTGIRMPFACPFHKRDPYSFCGNTQTGNLSLPNLSYRPKNYSALNVHPKLRTPLVMDK
jgi:hypothetical protein